MAEVKTQKTKASVSALLNAIEDDQVRKDCKTVSALMQKATRAKRAMWASSIVGFGSIHLIAVAALVAGLPAFGAASVAAQTADGLDAAIGGFVVAFNNLDMPKFLACFAEDATVFHPPSPPPRTFPTRIQGRREIERTFQVVFDQIRERSGRATPPYMDLQPEDLLIQRFDGMAVVTFHLGTPAERARRTLVFRRAGEGWTIVHLHASIFGAAQR